MAARNTHEARNRVRSARAAVHADLEALDDKLHNDVAERVRNLVNIVGTGAAAVGVLLVAAYLWRRKS